MQTCLIWTSPRHNGIVIGCSGPSHQLGVDEFMPSAHVWLLWVTNAANFGLDTHLVNVCKTCETGIGKDTGLFVRFITTRLLQLVPGVCAKEGYGQVATGSGRCCASDDRNPEPRAWYITRLLRDDLHLLTIPQSALKVSPFHVTRCTYRHLLTYLLNY